MSIELTSTDWSAIAAGVSALASIISAGAIFAFYRQSRHAAEQTGILRKQLESSVGQADLLKLQLEEQRRSNMANATMTMLLEPQRETLYDAMKSVLLEKRISDYAKEDALTSEQVEKIKDCTDSKRAIRRYLGRLEQICLYVNMNVLDEEMARRLIGSRMESTYEYFELWIAHVQSKPGQGTAYEEIKRTAIRWKALKTQERAAQVLLQPEAQGLQLAQTEAHENLALPR